MSIEPIQTLKRLREESRLGGGRKRIEAQHAKGKLTARERLDLLLDEGTFYEIDPFVTHRCTDFGLAADRPLGDSVVAGHGKVDGRPVFAFSQDFTVFGGSFSEVHAAKICKIMDLALEAGRPVIGLNDSGGARIQEGIRSLAGYGALFTRNTLASGVIPQVSVMLGPCAGGSVYSPGLTDFVIMTGGTSQMFITGPDVIRNVTGEEVDFETLGGAMTHAATSGVAHFATQSEEESLALARRLLSYLPANNAEAPPYVQPTDDPWRTDAELDTIVPADPAQAYDVYRVIERVFDRDSFLEVHAHFARNVVVGFARLHGAVVGVVAQQPEMLAGALDIDAADKICRFVRFCDCFNVPLITFVDSPGFLPGVGQEHGGIIRHGAKIVYAYAEATVPKISIVTRKAYGGAYIVMASKTVRTDLCLAWPSAEVAVMGAEGAVDILFKRDIAAADDPQAARQRLIDDFRRKFAPPYVAASTGFIDDVIVPSQTRPRLIAALEVLRDKQASVPRKKHGNMPV